MTTKTPTAEFFADLEGDATPFAAAPRFVAGHSIAPGRGAGNQSLAITSVHATVLEALRATGYEEALAQRMAKEIADSVPRVQQKAQAAA